jgi:hypothetical protein
MTRDAAKKSALPMVGRIAIIQEPGGAAVGWITLAS